MSLGQHPSGVPFIRLLGTPVVEVCGKTVTSFRSNRIPALLGLLAIRTGAISREEAAAALWPESNPEDARHNLRQTIHYAKGILGPDAFIADRQHLELAPDIASDVGLLYAAQNPLLPEDEAMRLAEKAAASVRGPFLRGYDDDWIFTIRMDCVRIHVQTLLKLADHYAEIDPRRALEYATAAAKEEPFLDSARAKKIRALKALGEDAAAHHEFSDYKSWLGRELGVEPSRLVTDALGEPKTAAESTQVSELPAGDAIDTLLNGPRPTHGLRLASSFTPFWISKGETAVGIKILESAIARCGAAASADLEEATVSLAELQMAAGSHYLADKLLQNSIPKISDTRSLIRALTARSSLRIAVYRAVEGEQDLLRALELARPSSLLEDEAEIHKCLADMYLQTERLDRAEEHAEKCMVLAKQVGDWSVYARAVSTSAAICLCSGRASEAKDIGLRALKELEGKEGAQAAFVRVRICRILEEAGELKAAEAGYRKGIAEARIYGDLFGLGVALTYLGDMLTLKGEFTEALKVHEEAKRVRMETNEELGLATSLRGIGRAYLALRQYDDARTALKESANLFLACDAAPGHASALLELARTAQGTGELSLAKRLAARARDLLVQMSSVSRMSIGVSGDELAGQAQELVDELNAQ